MIGTYCPACHQSVPCVDNQLGEHFVSDFSGDNDYYAPCPSVGQAPMTDAQVLTCAKVQIRDYFDLKDCPFNGIFKDSMFVWDALNKLPTYIHEFTKTRTRQALLKHGLVSLSGPLFYTAPVQLGNDATIDPGVYINGNVLIGQDARIGAGALIRGNVLISQSCVVGHGTEVKDSIMLPAAKAPHRNFVGDSIIGAGANLGNGVCLANWKLNTGDRGIVVHNGTFNIPTGRNKFGAIIGDHTEIGCNTVTAPGTLIGPRTNVYPLMRVRGVIPADSMVSPSEAPPKIRPRRT